MTVAEHITAVRLAEYLNEVDGDPSRALELYMWNSRMSAECFILIGHLEILLRNSIDEVLQLYYHDKERGIPWFLQLGTDLSTEDRESIQRVREELRKRRKPDSRDRIIAGLTFGFWSHMFNTQHDELWKLCLYRVFRNGENPKITRKEVAALVEQLRLTRNRVAHHNYLKQFDVPNSIASIFQLARLISPEYATWMENNSTWREIYENSCPAIDTDTVIIPGRVAWDIYQHQPIYVCRKGRFFRDMRYLGFYEDKYIRNQIPRIKHVFDDVEWTPERAQELCESNDHDERTLGKAMQWALSEEGTEVAHGWKHAKEGYKVFLLTPYREQQQGDDGHHVLPNGDLPHESSVAYVRNHRYTSLHRLLSARTTDDLSVARTVD
ncbi:hypothetical protein [Bifidobacterium cuniculi]|uniref:Abi-like protein n=1 Tax=Bifidobacterium cuniculi TaxID=1688 RepID=A0A087ATH3_9BIFI|nr:hypothetical protein [Bifidobacterium cuniculi]KFI62073.1 hypothetical protein BCUN_1389 [Bifidobacterium cuniculi]